MPVAIEPARQRDVEALLDGSEQFALSLYPPDSCYLLDVSELEAPGVEVFVARVDDVALGMAALVPYDGYGELKRLFVDDRARGQGLAGQLLAAVEDRARERGLPVLRLETGPLSVAAIALYGKHGYERIPNFGPYVGDEHSYCMEKPL
ncbi:GNAT family N-acetyltransferase [Salinibacterium soli]|uniref:GNAT family N-acetyltransferase n=1 Tax=Antiquaquibacter soli TaxID=3064523 RepID=A0ABT9BPL6_9MICO|nr:GNAT family N-acetyltransferase [Protaetiibacter sp. WY-16]MDO7882966.1 GNAT family N-acetyltransferase [Protaetiibacter sp. WY-16]